MRTRSDLRNEAACVETDALRTVSRAMLVLTSYLDQDSWGVSAMARHLGLNKSVVHRLMKTLASANMLAFDERLQAYVLGPTCASLGERASRSIGLVEQARPILEHLQQTTRETISLCVVREDEGYCVDFAESAQAMRYTVFRGQRFPLNAGAIGKVLLAFQPAGYVDRLIVSGRFRSYTSDTIVEPDALRSELAAIRARGFAFSEGEIDEGARSVGVPIWGRDGSLAASLSVSAPSSRMLDAVIPGLVADLTEGAGRLSRALGFSPGPTRSIPRKETAP